jgi:GNAT acetyltransferase
VRSIILSDIELMKIQAETLYVLDIKNRIIRINESYQAHSPAVFFGKTKECMVTYFHHELPESIIEEVIENTAESIDIMNLCRIIEKYKMVKEIYIGPAYKFNHVDCSSDLANGVIVINESNRHLLMNHFPILMNELEERTPAVGYLLNNEIVSVCCCARKSPKAAEASLKTIEGYRGKGYAQQVVLEWSKEVTKLSLIPLYSTSWDNLSSQKVAQKLDLVQYGMDFSISIMEVVP